MFKPVSSVAVFALLLAACETPSHHDPKPDANADACGASGYQSLIGSNVAAITLPADLYHRIIRPGDAVTKDYRLSRLNIITDENGVVTEVYCG